MNTQVKPLEWSEHKKPTEQIGFDHVEANTPFGRFIIAWKGHRANTQFTLISHPFLHGSAYCLSALDRVSEITLDDAKETTQKWYSRMISDCMVH